MVAIEVRDFLGVVGVAVSLDGVRVGGVGVGAALFDELFGPSLVDFFSLALKVRAVAGVFFWAFVPVEAEPFKSVFN